MVCFGLPHSHVPSPSPYSHVAVSEQNGPDCDRGAIPRIDDIRHHSEHLAEKSAQDAAQHSQGLGISAIASSLIGAL